MQPKKLIMRIVNKGTEEIREVYLFRQLVMQHNYIT